jgi:hypothetical protein
MNITESKLREIIKEEYLRLTPVSAGELMSEHRAMHLAEELINEGLWDSIKALAAGSKAAVKTVAGAGAEALGSAANSVVAPMIKAGTEAAQAIKAVKDDAVKAAAAAAAESLKKSIQASLKTSIADMIKKLVASGKDEATAKKEAGQAIGPALSQAIASALNQ